ncbi:hypothetical protein LINPERHAP1_LOCUS22514, partial [Linum perenne]
SHHSFFLRKISNQSSFYRLFPTLHFSNLDCRLPTTAAESGSVGRRWFLHPTLRDAFTCFHCGTVSSKFWLSKSLIDFDMILALLVISGCSLRYEYGLQCGSDSNNFRSRKRRWLR